MRKVISKESREKRVKELISEIKYLNNPKYFKNNRISMAAWDSWAAQGQAGGCRVCGIGHYNGSLINTRRKVDICNLCNGCITEVEKQVNFEFKTY